MKPILSVSFLSTYPPRECGIATFTQDLVQELKKKGYLKIGVIAISDANYTYNNDVLFSLQQHDRRSYVLAAERINASDIQALIIEHEFGIFGGESGEYLLDLIDRVTKPIFITLHTVLPLPEEKQRQILKKICSKSEKIVIMASNTCKILQEVYEVDLDKIEIIHHGVPSFELPSKEALKRQMHLEDRTIISTFGLVSPGKGLEYGIEAIARVAMKHPNVLYLILGETHPVVRRQYGETYRSSLEKRARELKLEDNVRFVNKYLTKEEIIKWLKLSDIYITPYLSRSQAVSGTLAYAVGYGKAIISTPYPYAREMLADGRGLLVDYEDAESLSESIRFLIEHPEERQTMEEKNLRLGKTMRWDVIADCYIKRFFKHYHDFQGWNRLKNERTRVQVAE